eukprot:scaffold46125_cov157-Isochrysis_galbana.AAC.1
MAGVFSQNASRSAMMSGGSCAAAGSSVGAWYGAPVSVAGLSAGSVGANGSAGGEGAAERLRVARIPAASSAAVICCQGAGGMPGA